jgi:gluconolactonase
MSKRMLLLTCCVLAVLSCRCRRGEGPDRQKGGGAMPADKAISDDFEIRDESFREILAEGAALEPIATGLKFTEGPVWLADRRCLLFSDIPADTIYRWTQGKGLVAFRKPSRMANGNTVDLQRRLVTCEHGSRSVTRTERDGSITTLAAGYNGRKLNSPNDCVVKSDGTIWFTDPPYGVEARLIEQPGNYVFRLDPGSAEPVVVADDFGRPNGLCFSPDEGLLYVADSDRKVCHVRRFRVDATNMLRESKVFVNISSGAPDGMRVDAAGRLYCTAGDGVHVYSAGGALLGKIRTPKPASNCAFGGLAGKTLFITARDGVWSVKLSVSGAK